MRTEIIRKYSKTERMFPNISRVAILSFLVSLILFSFMTGAVIISTTHNETLQKEQFILEKSLRIEETLSKLFYKTEILAALVRHGEGDIQDFEGIAALIVDDPAILNILIAPGGVVSNVYSVYGDESLLLGHDFFSESGGNLEAIKAVESGEFVMAGPFVARQGYVVLAGRLPVYLDAEKTDFWGLVSVTLRFPEALDNAELGRLRTQGYEYELWRINPDTGERQVLDSNLENANPNVHYVEKEILFLNAEWHLRLLAARSWYNHPEVIILIIAGVFISVLISYIIQSNHQLKKIRTELAVLAKTDPLTGIYNRRHFDELVEIDAERAHRFNEDAYIIVFDLDRFKKINDTYGHSAGDKVLVEVARRMKETIRPYDLLARYGGEEFIVYMPKTDRDGAAAAAERLRLELCNHPCELAETYLTISASFGVAKVDESGVENAIRLADAALYRAKETGRNKVVLHDSPSS